MLLVCCSGERNQAVTLRSIVIKRTESGRVLTQHTEASHDDQHRLRSGQRHICAPRVCKEADAVMLIGTHACNDDDIHLLALEAIDCAYLDMCSVPPIGCLLQFAKQRLLLCRVRRDNTSGLEARLL